MLTDIIMCMCLGTCNLFLYILYLRSIVRNLIYRYSSNSSNNSTLSVRSEPDMFSFLKSQWRPDPPEPDLEALDMAVIQAECQGTSNT